ncbi:helix-turn-helix domain-containing protein [Streptomyces cinereoruber]|uniref:helix-turn-helix domain-containing protein n=1 Tax=Streptomyces cinereoruber TaxID=67260 RepID=UPI0036452BB3
MEHPGRGAPYSVGALAQAAGIPKATVGHLLTGRTGSCEVQAAHDIAEALGVAVLVLFAPSPSPNPTDSSPKLEHERGEEPTWPAPARHPD